MAPSRPIDERGGESMSHAYSETCPHLTLEDVKTHPRPRVQSPYERASDRGGTGRTRLAAAGGFAADKPHRIGHGTDRQTGNAVREWERERDRDRECDRERESERE